MTEGTSTSRRRGTRGRVLHLPAQLGIADVAGFKPVLADALEGGRSVILDAAALEHVDGAGLQLLLAFHTAMHSAGRRMDWKSPPPALLEAAGLFGVRETLGLNT